MIKTKRAAIQTRDVYRFRLNPLVTQLLETDEVYSEEFDQNKILQYLISEMEIIPPEQFLAITNNELIERLERLMALELVYGLLDDLTADEIQLFDEAIAGR